MQRTGRGFTLLEILIAASVLTIFLTGVYKLYRGVVRSFQQANWSLAMQTEARNGLTFLREEMQRASYKTTISIGSVVVDEEKTMKIRQGTTQTDAVLAEWYIGIPFRTDTPSTGACFKSTVAMSGGKLVYTKTLDSGTNTGEPLFNGKVLMENLTSVALNLEPFDVDDASGTKLVSIVVELRHPMRDQYPNTKVIERTGAKVDVKVEDL
ncbi:MAG TPA: prepilin-type N-terminal cleavage/methylation domain-containing protein [Candidatus Ozemobacteraceae bacterium]|nr:prepilin-type N-terminal cleavage/methylation domain-containing protein [Candidatus Ozemobacteraceae bacterium]